MQKAEYPQKTCREPIFGDSGIGYACELVNMHTGPHATFSSRGSVQRRDAWEAANPAQVGLTSLDGGDVIVDNHGRPIT